MKREEKQEILRQVKRLEEGRIGNVNCRVGGDRHHWLPVQPDWKPQAGLTAIAAQCQNCLTVKRMDVESDYGIVIGRPRYDYPEDYLLKRGERDSDGERLMSPNAVRAFLAGRKVTRKIKTSK